MLFVLTIAFLRARNCKYLSSLRKQSRLGEMRGGRWHPYSLRRQVLFEKDQLTIQQIAEDHEPLDYMSGINRSMVVFRSVLYVFKTDLKLCLNLSCPFFSRVFILMPCSNICSISSSNHVFTSLTLARKQSRSSLMGFVEGQAMWWASKL